jgi:hypothetical protein
MPSSAADHSGRHLGERAALRDLEPRDPIDVQSFIWVQGSEEYAE